MADTVKSSSAVPANTAEPTRVVSVGESTISTTPAARASGVVAACSQPRRCGLTSSLISWTRSLTWWAASEAASCAFSATRFGSGSWGGMAATLPSGTKPATGRSC